jgi:hypothetical protein
MATIDERLDAIEARLSKLETQGNVKAPLLKAQPVKLPSIDASINKPIHAGPPLATQL